MKVSNRQINLNFNVFKHPGVFLFKKTHKIYFQIQAQFSLHLARYQITNKAFDHSSFLHPSISSYFYFNDAVENTIKHIIIYSIQSFYSYQ